jgi:membrane-associated phospholipid phosphatase
MGLEEHLSDFGNALVASAAALVILAWLWGRLGWVSGLVFLICFLGVIGAVVGLKLIAYDLRPPVGETSMFALSQGAPSGHTALATIVYGGLAAILIVVDRRPRAWIAAIACLAVIVAVAVTRVTLARHTAGDVIAGLLVAGIGVGIFTRALKVQTRDRSTGAMGLFAAVSAVTILLLVSGLRFNTLALL